MNHYIESSAFIAYAITCLVLCINLLVLWGYSGAVRGKTKTAINHEDSVQFGSALKDFDPPEVARVLRAHGNAQANIYPFLFLGLVFVLAGGSTLAAEIIFGIFTVARLLHSVVYVAGKQPWRTAFFVLGGLATIALLVEIGYLVVKGLSGP